MNKRNEKIVMSAALLVAVCVTAVILANAWKVLTTPADTAGSSENAGAVEQEAADQLWVSEEELESNKNMTLSLKEAVLGASAQKKDLEVYEQQVSDIIKVTDDGILPFKLSSKYRYIKYSGTAIYTVDLSGINEESLYVDEEDKTITIRIPHTEERLIINEEETQADETENAGIFSIGDLKQTEEERNEVIANVKTNMRQKLEEENAAGAADRMAKLSVWEIYQPVVTKISPEYTVVVEFMQQF